MKIIAHDINLITEKEIDRLSVLDVKKNVSGNVQKVHRFLLDP